MKFRDNIKLNEHKEAILMRDGLYVYSAGEVGLTDRESSDPVLVMRKKEEVQKAYNRFKELGELPYINTGHPDDFVNLEDPASFKDGKFINPELAQEQAYTVLKAKPLLSDESEKLFKDGLVELSCGWSGDFEKVDGEYYEYEQKFIDFNHVAGVPQGRCGYICSIKDGVMMKNKDSKFKVIGTGRDGESNNRVTLNIVASSEQEAKEKFEREHPIYKALEVVKISDASGFPTFEVSGLDENGRKFTKKLKANSEKEAEEIVQSGHKDWVILRSVKVSDAGGMPTTKLEAVRYLKKLMQSNFGKIELENFAYAVEQMGQEAKELIKTFKITKSDMQLTDTKDSTPKFKITVKHNVPGGRYDDLEVVADNVVIAKKIALKQFAQENNINESESAIVEAYKISDSAPKPEKLTKLQSSDYHAKEEGKQLEIGDYYQNDQGGWTVFTKIGEVSFSGEQELIDWVNSSETVTDAKFDIVQYTPQGKKIHATIQAESPEQAERKFLSEHPELKVYAEVIAAVKVGDEKNNLEDKGQTHIIKTKDGGKSMKADKIKKLIDSLGLKNISVEDFVVKFKTAKIKDADMETEEEKAAREAREAEEQKAKDAEGSEGLEVEKGKLVEFLLAMAQKLEKEITEEEAGEMAGEFLQTKDASEDPEEKAKWCGIQKNMTKDSKGMVKKSVLDSVIKDAKEKGIIEGRNFAKKHFTDVAPYINVFKYEDIKDKCALDIKAMFVKKVLGQDINTKDVAVLDGLFTAASKAYHNPNWSKITDAPETEKEKDIKDIDDIDFKSKKEDK